jgi:ribosomal protein L37AE/L43A
MAAKPKPITCPSCGQGVRVVPGVWRCPHCGYVLVIT